MSIYRFPSMANIDEMSLKDQLEKIKSEWREAKCAEIRYRCSGESKHELGVELLDIIHATETALRIVFTDEEVEELRADVIKKNAVRSYYEGRH